MCVVQVEVQAQRDGDQQDEQRGGDHADVAVADQRHAEQDKQARHADGGDAGLSLNKVFGMAADLREGPPVTPGRPGRSGSA